MEWILVFLVVGGASWIGARYAHNYLRRAHEQQFPGVAPPKEPHMEPFARRIAGGWEYIDEYGEAWRSENGWVWHDEQGRRAALEGEARMQAAKNAVESRRLWKDRK